MTDDLPIRDAAELLAQHIQQFDDPTICGLMIEIFVNSINGGDTPAMALALAKNLLQEFK